MCIWVGSVSSFVGGQVMMALSLRGRGNFTAFKDLLWNFLLESQQYIWENPNVGPGPAADKHRTDFFNTFFPGGSARARRRNMLKHWAVVKLPNGDIRQTGKFTHYCRRNVAETAETFCVS